MNTQLEAGLYLLSTPIGNKGDITLRTLEVLTECDIIVSEDTRIAKKLLSMYKISLSGRKLVNYSDNITPYARKKILESIKDGKVVAMISDAGSPLISDPGYKLVSEVINIGANLVSLPGASSVLTALTLSGLPTNKFYFYGFLPVKKSKRSDELEKIKYYNSTIIFFESSKRLNPMLRSIGEIFGEEHLVAVCREMTKKFEEVQRGPLMDILTEFERRESIKGEIVVVVGPASTKNITEKQIEGYLLTELKNKSVKDSVEFLSKTLSISKKVLYDRALRIKK